MSPEAQMARDLEDHACEIQHELLIKTIDERVEVKVNSCKGDIAKEMHEMNSLLRDMTGAFVVTKDGKPDVQGHRNAHEAMIEAAKAERDFWMEMKRDLAKKGLWGLLVILIGLLWIGIQIKLGMIKVGA